MARPQIEDGHCDIALELLEAIIKTRFSNTEHAVFWAIVRKTYGWHKKMDRISFSQLEELTGINRRHVGPVLKRLIQRNIVLCSNAGERKTSEYGVQKDYEKWLMVLTSDTVSSASTDTENSNRTDTDLSNNLTPKSVTDNKTNLTPITVSSDTDLKKSDTEIGTNLTPPAVHTNKNTKDNTKETIQKSTYGEFTNVFLSDEDYQKLITEKMSKPKADDLIEQLSSYMKQNPANARKYVDHYATILNWSRKDGRKDGQNIRNLKESKVKRLPGPADFPDPADM